MRRPDKPGTFRIKPKGSGFVLSGVRTDGNRVRVSGLSRDDAQAMADKLFPKTVIELPPVPGSAASQTVDTTERDEWGMPKRLTAESLPNLGAAAAQPKPKEPTEQEKKQTERDKHAKSLMELAGIGYAAGDVWLGRKVCEWLDHEIVRPNDKQVNMLAECSKETFVEWFGDIKVKPWQMMVILSIGIPMTMVVQSRKIERKPVDDPSKSAPLRSVPQQS